MNNLSKQQIDKIAKIAFPVAMVVISVYLYYEFEYKDYKFETIIKVSDIYEEPVYLLFNWKTKDELMTGKHTTVYVTAKGLPYNSTTIDKVEIIFEGIGHWKDEGDTFSEKLSEDDRVTFVTYNEVEETFQSDKLELRYATFGKKDILFCDDNIVPKCIQVKEIVEVAAHATSFEIKLNKISITVAVIVLLASGILGWLTYRQKSTKTI